MPPDEAPRLWAVSLARYLDAEFQDSCVTVTREHPLLYQRRLNGPGAALVSYRAHYALLHYAPLSQAEADELRAAGVCADPEPAQSLEEKP